MHELGEELLRHTPNPLKCKECMNIQGSRGTISLADGHSFQVAGVPASRNDRDGVFDQGRLHEQPAEPSPPA